MNYFPSKLHGIRVACHGRGRHKSEEKKKRKAERLSSRSPLRRTSAGWGETKEKD